MSAKILQFVPRQAEKPINTDPDYSEKHAYDPDCPCYTCEDFATDQWYEDNNVSKAHDKNESCQCMDCV